jgi:hypothetical protein
MFTRVFAALIASLALSSCLENTGIAAKAGSTIAKSQANCLAPDALAVRAVNVRLAASSVTLSSDFCTKPGGYDCFIHKFGPSVPNGDSVISESANVAELGGDVSITMSSQTFNTAAVARLSTVAGASQPGGELNHVEYICHQHDLWDAETTLAVGESDNLKDALSKAYTQCSGIAPRVVN